LAEIEEQPPQQRAQTLFELYRISFWGAPLDAVRIAKGRNLVDHSRLEPLIARLGALAVPRILDLIEEFGFGRRSLGRRTSRN
jgi:hypothetical protein